MKRILPLSCIVLFFACKTVEIDNKNSYIIDENKSYIKVENETYSFQYPKTYDYYMSHGFPNYYPKEIYPKGKYNVVWLNNFYLIENPITQESNSIETEFKERAKKQGENDVTYQYSIKKVNTKFGETFVFEDYHIWGFDYVYGLVYSFDRKGIRYNFTYRSKSRFYEKYLPVFEKVFNTLKFKD
ncbi:MAG: hypothetical protein BM563_11355 [Bacteroidetes bacterium MedPE-SWsnd-G1]|nr:MAG: hypothetical protein BM563_11355 [Bacteroidetes bacterium MedPE-SWsnd-G1]